MEKHTSITKYFVLLSLSKRSTHGYELIGELGRMTGKKPSPGQIYPVLKQLKSLGYLNVAAKMDGKRRTKHYSLTRSGRKFFGSMSQRFDALIRSALKEKIKVCSHCSCEIFKGAYRKKMGKRMYDFCCVSCAASYAHSYSEPNK